MTKSKKVKKNITHGKAKKRVEIEDHKYAESAMKNSPEPAKESKEKPKSKTFDTSSIKKNIEEQLKEQRESIENISKLKLKEKYLNFSVVFQGNLS